MIKVGLIGSGKWGAVIINAINDSVEFVDSKDADWIIISTPNDLHYEQVRYWLSGGKNVFCEQPLTLTYETSEELFKLADDNGVTLYVDDVFCWRTDIEQTPTFFNWSKENNVNFIDRFAYHHFYLIYDQIGFQSCKIKVEEGNTLLHKKFQLIYELEDDIVTYDFEYNLEWYGGKVDTVKYTDNDALLQMLKQVLNEEVDFDTVVEILNTIFE